MRWNIFDKNNNWLGEVHAATADAAIEVAKQVYNLKDAYSAKPYENSSMRD